MTLTVITQSLNCGLVKQALVWLAAFSILFPAFFPAFIWSIWIAPTAKKTHFLNEYWKTFHSKESPKVYTWINIYAFRRFLHGKTSGKTKETLFKTFFSRAQKLFPLFLYSSPSQDQLFSTTRNLDDSSPPEIFAGRTPFNSQILFCTTCCVAAKWSNISHKMKPCKLVMLLRRAHFSVLEARQLRVCFANEQFPEEQKRLLEPSGSSPVFYKVIFFWERALWCEKLRGASFHFHWTVLRMVLMYLTLSHYKLLTTFVCNLLVSL